MEKNSEMHSIISPKAQVLPAPIKILVIYSNYSPPPLLGIEGDFYLY